MKNLLSIRFRTLAKMFLVSILFTACGDDHKVTPQTECNVLALKKPYNSTAPYYNLNIYLKGEKATSCGYVEFRQVQDNAQFIHLDTWVHGMEPNTSYILQRAVDKTLDGNCTSTEWLTLGEALTPKSIVTDSKGEGYAELFRSVASVPVGTPFDIHFQILKESNSMVVLSSECLQYSVR